MNEEITLCKHCGKPIEFHSYIPIDGLEWKHSDGFYSCGGRQGHAETYAEPKSTETLKGTQP